MTHIPYSNISTKTSEPARITFDDPPKQIFVLTIKFNLIKISEILIIILLCLFWANVFWKILT